MGEITIKVKVPNGREEAFKKVVEEIAEFYNKKEVFFNLIDELKGSVKTKKTWKELKLEAYEQDFHR